ncbi:MAG: UbiD family decarboxylase [Alicyclobacillus sp.]|nr:UbiD family decarboxylase [Alicyclobacillus sp.]
MGDQRATQDLRAWLDLVEQHGSLLRVREAVSVEEEMSGITYLVAMRQPAPALLFENVQGYPGARVLFNLIGSSQLRYNLALGLPPEMRPLAVIEELRQRLKNPIAPRTVDPSEVPFYRNTRQGEEVRLSEFPAPKHWPLDGGHYIGTADVVITQDPETGVVNVGTYRQMIHNDREVGVMFSPGKDGRLHMNKWFQRGEPMPIAAAWGIHPLLLLVGSAGFPKNVCEYDYAGGLMGEPVEVTPGKLTGLPIPARAEVVIEGYVYPDMRMEGPFGEFTGYYGRPGEPAPYVKVEAIHFRDQPILTAALMAEYPACEQELFLALMRAARLRDDFDRLGVPGIRGVYSVPQAAAGFGMTVVAVEQQYPGHVTQVLSIAAQAPSGAYFTKWVVAVDEDIDPTDIDQVLWAMATRVNPAEDIEIQRNTWSTWLDPAQNPPEKRPYGSRVLVNACKQHQFLKTYSRRTAIRRTLYDRISARWQALGLPGEPPEIRFFHED